MQKYYVIIDSNFLFLPIQFKIDYLHEIFLNLGGKTNLILFQQILNELNSKLKRETQARKFKMDFEASLQYLEMNKEKYNSLPKDLQKVIDECSGTVGTDIVGKAWNEAAFVFKSIERRYG